MASPDIRPRWWQLYLTIPLLIILFAVDNRIKLSIRGHQIVQIGILLIVYGLIQLWLKANTTALSKMDRRQYYGTVTAIRVPPYQLPEPNSNKRSMFQFPDSEIKGTLSNIFEMDTIDAEFSSVDVVPHETNKEQK
jgi:hypothetical protein